VNTCHGPLHDSLQVVAPKQMLLCNMKLEQFLLHSSPPICSALHRLPPHSKISRCYLCPLGTSQTCKGSETSCCPRLQRCRASRGSCPSGALGDWQQGDKLAQGSHKTRFVTGSPKKNLKV